MILGKSNDFIFDDIDNVPEAQTAIILGAKVHEDGTMSDMLYDRVMTAIDLYNGGKVEKILISGDHGRIAYDEVGTVKDFLLKKGVKKQDIFIDHAGFDTYDSMYRARDIFKIDSAIVVTQEFHLNRAVYIGKSLGLNVYGMKADRHIYLGMEMNIFREYFARVKAFFNVLFNSKPKFLGEEIPITGDSSRSWD